jgi:hypothetical protein
MSSTARKYNDGTASLRAMYVLHLRHPWLAMEACKSGCFLLAALLERTCQGSPSRLTRGTVHEHEHRQRFS